MQTQLQAQISDESQTQMRNLLLFTRRQVLAATIIITTFTSIVVATLTIIGLIPTYLAVTISTVYGLLGAIFALWPLIFSANTSELVISLSPLTLPTSYRGLAAIVPPIDVTTIQQREKIVQDVYSLLMQKDANYVALIGVAGIGKSTATLVCQYAEEQRRAGKKSFTTGSLWLAIDPSVTMTDLARNLFEMMRKPRSNFGNLSPQNQTVIPFNILNTFNRKYLLLLDQFENVLNWQTGYALSSHPGIGEWPDTLNSQKLEKEGCRVHFWSGDITRDFLDHVYIRESYTKFT